MTSYLIHAHKGRVVESVGVKLERRLWARRVGRLLQQSSLDVWNITFAERREIEQLILDDYRWLSLLNPVSFQSFTPDKSRANDCNLLIVLPVWCGDCDQTHSVLHSAVPVCHDELVTTGKFVMDKNVTMNSVLLSARPIVYLLFATCGAPAKCPFNYLKKINVF